MKTHFYHIFFILFCIFSGCKEQTAKKTLPATVVTKVIINDSLVLEQSGKMLFYNEKPSIKDCFLALNDIILPIPVTYRITMMENYEIRDVLQQPYQMEGESENTSYNFEIDNIDSLNDYMMFSIFNDNRESNYFLRYFKDTTGNEAHAIGLSRIEKKGEKKYGYSYFVAQAEDSLIYIDSLFPKITLRDFADEKNFQKLNLSAAEIENPNLLVWLPGKRKKDNTILGIDLNFDAFGDKKTAVKSACRRTNMKVVWAEGVFEKEGLKPIIIQPHKRKIPNRKPKYRGGKSRPKITQNGKSHKINAKKVVKSRK